MKPRDVFLRALRRQPTPRFATGSATSVVTADLMDRVGVSFPQANVEAGAMAELAAAGHTVLGFDNVMPLYSVWHESAALGCKVHWGDRTHMPDGRGGTYALHDEVPIPDDLLARPSCRVALDAIERLANRFGGNVAVVGKVFGGWTLGYHLFGVQEFLINTILDPDAVRRAIDHLKEVAIVFGQAQIDAGADALCYADHATRDLCSPDAYRDFLRDVHAEMAERLPVPLILHICGDTSDRIGYIRETGMACFHFDAKVPAPLARELAGEEMSLMGGTSNIDVILNGTPEEVRDDVRAKADARIDILGPECAVPLDAPYRNMQALTETVFALAPPGESPGQDEGQLPER